MLDASVRWNRGTGGLRAYAGLVAKPVIAISIGYCALSNISFQSAADGSFSMSGAKRLGLVTTDYAKRHPNDSVLFKQIGPALFEYRVKRPLVGYAGIPWLVARRTEIDLARRCASIGREECKLEAD